MKQSTVANKLAALLGIADKVDIPEKFQDPKAKKNGRTGYVAVNEEDIQEFREAQGVIYFLQAPALFQYKKCENCGDTFLVSRRFVACCSYNCIKHSLEKKGMSWSKGHDLEALAMDPQVYDGNEPIWIRNLDKLENVLSRLVSMREKV